MKTVIQGNTATKRDTGVSPAGMRHLTAVGGCPLTTNGYAEAILVEPMHMATL